MIKSLNLEGFVDFDKCFYYKDTYYVIFEMLTFDMSTNEGLKLFHKQNNQENRISQYITAF